MYNRILCALVRLSICLSLATVSGSAMAYGSFSLSGTFPFAPATNPIDFTHANIGDKLASYQASFSYQSGCCGLWILSLPNAGVGNTNGYFRTDIPGIGYKIFLPNKGRYLGYGNASDHVADDKSGTVQATWEIYKISNDIPEADDSIATISNLNFYGSNGGSSASVSPKDWGPVKIHFKNYPECAGIESVAPITLPSATSSALNQGTAASAHFSINLLQCSKNRTIKTMFHSTASALDANQGIVGPDASSTTTGVGVQILDSSNTPVVLDTYGTPVPTMDGSISLRYNARMVSPGHNATPGDFHATVTFTLQYD